MTGKSAPDIKEAIAWGRKALELESQSLMRTASLLGPSFGEAVSTMLQCRGKIVITGLGKSGHIAGKIASTLASTGTSAFYLHPTEALHGDFGMIRPEDCLLAIAFSGETVDVVKVAKYARRIAVPVIALTGRARSSLALLANIVLDGSVEREACPLNLAPTSSSTVSLALGDALAVGVMRARGFSEQDFAQLHPEGTLGRRLSLVGEHMKEGDSFARITVETSFHGVLEAVTHNNIGITAVVSASGELIGSISDGDVRRVLLKHDSKALGMQAGEFMSSNPKRIDSSWLAVDALRLMEQHKITRLFVVSSPTGNAPVGIVRIQDLLEAKVG